MSGNRRTNRREILKNTAAFGTASATGLVGVSTASANKATVDIDSLLARTEVESIVREIPGLELQSDDTTVLENESVIVLIPANYGSLVVTDSENGRTAAFYFEEGVPALDADWPKGTHARLRATADDPEPLFQRTTTDEEMHRYLVSIGASDLRTDDVHVSVTPETDEIDVTHINSDERVMNVIRAQIPDSNAEKARGTLSKASGSGPGAEIIERERYGTGRSADGSGGVQVASMGGCGGCGDDIALDVLYCLNQVKNCGLCTIGSPAPPVAVACWLIVCFGVSSADGVSAVLDDVNIPGCTNLAGCAVDCFIEEWKELW